MSENPFTELSFRDDKKWASFVIFNRTSTTYVDRTNWINDNNKRLTATKNYVKQAQGFSDNQFDQWLDFNWLWLMVSRQPQFEVKIGNQYFLLLLSLAKDSQVLFFH